MTPRLLWISAVVLCMMALGLNVEKPNNPLPLYLAFEPVLAVFTTLIPAETAPQSKSPATNLGRVEFGVGDVCCPGIPARNTVNIATGAVMPLN